MNFLSKQLYDIAFQIRAQKIARNIRLVANADKVIQDTKNQMEKASQKTPQQMDEILQKLEEAMTTLQEYTDEQSDSTLKQLYIIFCGNTAQAFPQFVNALKGCTVTQKIGSSFYTNGFKPIADTCKKQGIDQYLKKIGFKKFKDLCFKEKDSKYIQFLCQPAVQVLNEILEGFYKIYDETMAQNQDELQDQNNDQNKDKEQVDKDQNKKTQDNDEQKNDQDDKFKKLNNKFTFK